MAPTNPIVQSPPTVKPEGEYLINKHYTEAERYKQILDRDAPKIQAMLANGIDENTSIQTTFSAFYNSLIYYQENKPRAGKRLIADIERDIPEVTCTKSLSFTPIRPGGIKLTGSFKNLVFVDKTSYRMALRLPVIYFEIWRDQYIQANIYTSIRNAYNYGNYPYHRKYMPQPHCRSWGDPCWGDFFDPLDNALCMFDPKTALPILKDYLCSGGGHIGEIRQLIFGDPKIRFYSPAEMGAGFGDAKDPYWCPTYSRWGILRESGTNRRFYISPNEWLPVVDGMEFKSQNTDNKHVPCATLKAPMPDVRHLVQFDPNVIWKKGSTGVVEMWRYPLYTPQWKVRLAVLEQEKLRRKAVALHTELSGKKVVI